MMDKELILHIGTPKTGTTAIQQFFFHNKRRLLKKGIIYPGIQSNHITPFRDFLDPNSNKKELDLIIKEINRSKATKIVLSSEKLAAGFFRPFKNLSESEKLNPPEDRRVKMNTKLIFSLKEYLFENIKNLHGIKIVFYCRRQDLFLESLFNQALKSYDPKTINMYDPDRLKFLDYNSICCDYYQIASSWSSVFDKDNIIIRPYEKSQLIEGDIITDFCSIVGVNKSNFKEISIDLMNISWDPYQLLLWRWILHKNPSLQNYPKKSKYIQRKILELNFASKMKYPLFSPEERTLILIKYKLSNYKTAKEFLKNDDGILFKEDLANPNASWEPANLLSSELAKYHSLVYPDFYISLEFINSIYNKIKKILFYLDNII